MTPADGRTFPSGMNLLLGANAPDDGQVLSLEFFANQSKIGDARGPLATPMGAWLLTWTNPPAGTYLMTARASDDHGILATSAPVQLTISSALPQLRLTELSADGAVLFVQARAGSTNVIETSTDLQTWTPITTNLMPWGPGPEPPYFLFRDTASTNRERRFYRAFEYR